MPVLKPQFRDVVLSAVQKERISIQKLTKNIIIKGLSTSTFTNDATTASSLIYEQLGLWTEITSTCHLDKPASVQPLLIAFSDSKDAVLVVVHAKDLHNVSDDYIRNHLYINADLTPAEAKAVYEQRWQHRQCQFASG